MERCLACEAEGVAEWLSVAHSESSQLRRKSKELTIPESTAPISVPTPFGLASEAALQDSPAETLFAFSSAIGYWLSIIAAALPQCFT
jgi:hypothetical protein